MAKPIRMLVKKRLNVCKRLAQPMKGKPKNPFPLHSLAWATWIIARLGGWKGYQPQTLPGPITIKRGLQAFQWICIGWRVGKPVVSKHPLRCVYTIAFKGPGARSILYILTCALFLISVKSSSELYENHRLRNGRCKYRCRRLHRRRFSRPRLPGICRAESVRLPKFLPADQAHCK